MNRHYLMQYVSRSLHTLVRRFSSTRELIDSFCARADLQDDGLGPLLPGLLSSLDISTDIPAFFSLDQRAVYAVVPAETQIYIIGPAAFSDPVNIRRQLNAPIACRDLTALIPICSFQKFMENVMLICNLFRSEPVDEETIILENCVQHQIEEEVEQNYVKGVFENRESGKIHNPYDQEVREFTSIENGDIDTLKESLAEDYPGEIGTLASTPLRHMKNRGITVIVLASRAAIRGGVLPEAAYSLSDSYIQRIEACTDITSIQHLFHTAEYQYAQMVRDLRKDRSLDTGNHGNNGAESNIYAEKCKTYIFSHLHDKIYIRDIAEELNLNANYLSELFHSCVGITITEYIHREKIRLAKNLLTYSRYTYSEIAAHLGYSSQSHLGKQFKKVTGMTMHQYRIKYGAKLF